jgi:UTP:GlnB (protein PII) uridylyltransferase
LLYTISQTLTELALDISAARIVTERGAAIDSFYACELGGGKVASTERQLLIEDRLRTAIKRLDMGT